MKIGLNFFLVQVFIFWSITMLAQDTDVTESSVPISSAISIYPSKLRPLSIGDEVPDIEFKMVNYSKKYAKLSDFTGKGKLVILDFWATWCAACVSGFYKLESFQKKYKDKVQVILVNCLRTKDNEKNIIDYFSKRNLQIPSAIEDSFGYAFFPHSSIPHYVWITSDGKVKAITSTKEMTEENIEAVLAGSEINMPLKEDFKASKPMDIPHEIIMNDAPIYYSFFKKGRIDGGTNTNTIRRSTSNTGENTLRGIAIMNATLFQIYRTTFELHPEFYSKYTVKSIVLNVKDSSKLFFKSNPFEKEIWEKENLYTYDLIFPNIDSIELYSHIIKELNGFSGYHAEIKKQKVKCLVVIQAKQHDVLPEKQSRGYSIKALVHKLNESNVFKLPIFNETEFNGRIKISLPIAETDFLSFRQALHNYGLDLVETTRELNFLIISDQR